MKDIQKEPAYSTTVIELLKIANEYCIFLENHEKTTKEDLIVFIQKIMPIMYLKGSLLPAVEVDDPSVAERFVTEEQWENLFNEYRNKLFDIDEFWILNYDSPDKDTPVKASLSELLMDIYQDMKDFVLLYQKPARASKQNAVKDIKYLFETHWGGKTLQINQWVHSLNYKDLNTDTYTDLF